MPTILVTGAGRGLGQELARQYAADGWRVIGTERAARAEYRLDVTDPEQVRRLAAKLGGAPIDVLFCNSGITGKRGMALGSFDYESWAEVLRVNLLGVAAVIEALTENVAASERKVIAVMSSRLGSIAESSGMTLPYATSKAAPRGISVVALSPGWARTDMGGAGAPLSPQTSVEGLRKVVAGLKPADSGRFFSHDGSTIPW